METAGDPWQAPDGLARRLVLNGLTEWNADSSVAPALALGWQSDDNDHRWEFRLRPGVSFHDGSPLTADAVVMSLNLSCASSCPWTAVHAVGSSVIFTGDSPMPNLPALLAGDTYRIALTRTTDGQTPDHPIGTGPFQFGSASNGALTLTANENCWQGRPFVDQIAISANRSVRDQWLDLTLGRTDVVEVPPQEIRLAQQQRLTVLVSPPVELLALEVSSAGPLSNSALSASIALSVDRTALSNVIFQKQGEITASLLPQSLTGYAFLFPAARDLNKAIELRGGFMPPPLTLAAEGDGTMQLAAQRIALNLHEAGFNVQVANARTAPHPDLALRTLPLVGADPSAALEILLRAAGESASVSGHDPAALYRGERDVLDLHSLVPLLDLPRACAVSGRVRDLNLDAEGLPDLANASLEDAAP
ncbi:MAG: ABC transporter substrate-binding protein [Terracidiphilus sp.]